MSDGPEWFGRCPRVKVVLELDALSKRYGDVAALDGLSLRASPGRILGFLGPNGAGKTTSMRSVFGLVQLDEGSVRWEGRAVDRSTVHRFGYLPEERGLYPKMPAAAQVAHFGRLHGLSAADAATSAARWLDRLGLADRHADVPTNLSHGNQQRLQLAVAMVHDPDLLVLDEPFSGLDPIGREQLRSVIVDCAHSGATVVFSSHQLDLVQDLVDDVVIIARGRDQISGTLGEVRDSVGRHDVTIRVADGAVPDFPELTVTDQLVDGVVGHVPVGVDPGALLARLDGVTVREFGFAPPSLSTVFTTSVADR